MASSIDMLRAMTTEMLVDLMGVRLNGNLVGVESLTVNLTVTDSHDVGTLGVMHGALHFTPGRLAPESDVDITLTHLALARLASGRVGSEQLGPEELTVGGSREAFDRFLGWLDTFDASFAIVTAD